MSILKQQEGKNICRLLGVVCALLLALCLFPGVALAAEPEFEILYPSDEESVIAPGRDFYIVGTAPASQLQDKSITVELFRSGQQEPVRRLVGADTLAAGYDKATPALDSQYDGGMSAADTAMPDLVYDTAVAGSETDSGKKLAVTQNNFCALILGGANDGGLSSQGSPLTKGAYTIKVTLSSGAFITKDILIGDTADKSLVRYSPAEHYQKAAAYIRSKGIRMYVDPFPGYWSPVGAMAGSIYYEGAPLENDIFLESLSRWRFADGLEYETGNVHMFLYNISPSCASECVEMAAVQRTGRVETDLYCYYYALGEPSLRNGGETLDSAMIPLEQHDKLAFTRAQMGSGATEENSFAAYLPVACELDTDLTDGIVADEGETLELFGVTAPVQNSPAQLTPDGKNGYTAENHITSLRYTFYCGEEKLFEEIRAVGLERQYKEGKNSPSIYEFKHVFALEDKLAAGTFRVEAEALDKEGTLVEGGQESFVLTVLPAASEEPGAVFSLQWPGLFRSPWLLAAAAILHTAAFAGQ